AGFSLRHRRAAHRADAPAAHRAHTRRRSDVEQALRRRVRGLSCPHVAADSRNLLRQSPALSLITAANSVRNLFFGLIDRQESTVPESSNMRGAPKPPESPLPSPPLQEPSQYALLATFSTVARNVTGLDSTLKA